MLSLLFRQLPTQHLAVTARYYISLPASYTVPTLSDGVCDIRTEAGSEAGDVIKDVFADGSSQIQVEASVSGSDLYMYVTSLGFTYDRGING